MVTIKRLDLEKGAVKVGQKNVTPSNNLLLNSYFGNPIVGLYFLYVLNMHVNFMPIQCNLQFDL